MTGIDGRKRFMWLQQTRAAVSYDGDTCRVLTTTRKAPFTGASLTEAVNAGIAAIPLKAEARGGTKKPARKATTKPRPARAGAGT